MRDALADQWNVVAVYGGLGYGAEGLPAANSHYGYHLVAWHLLFALTGQVAELAGGLFPVAFIAAALGCIQRVFVCQGVQ